MHQITVPSGSLAIIGTSPSISVERKKEVPVDNVVLFSMTTYLPEASIRGPPVLMVA